MPDPAETDERAGAAVARAGGGPADRGWTPRADRVAPLVDGVEYFAAVREALLGARRQVLILGWDVHSEIDLLRGDVAARARADDGRPIRFADLLEDIVERREALHVRLLIWTGSSLFSLERQHLPRMKRPWSEHPRIELAWDDDTPRLASQHQKIVVIDDRVAFAGGMDLTRSRWDDHGHAMDDERRQTPGLLAPRGNPYHDTMLAVDGDAARRLGAWCRERWWRQTGERLEAPTADAAADGADAGDPWPDALRPVLRDRRVEMDRTQPDHAGRPEVREVEASFLEQIRAARRFLFIETQYFTCDRIAEALAAHLRETDGPEVILVLPYGCEGALQAMALDPHRDRLLDTLREADAHGRLGVYWPTLDGGREDDVFERSVYVHAKTMVADDTLLRIGSANLNHRSMGLDTELDCTVRAEPGDTEAGSAIAACRRRLLAYLLGVEPAAVADAEGEHGSPLRAVEALRGGRRTLEPFAHRAPRVVRSLALPIELADPDRPLSDEDARRVLEAIEAHVGVGHRARRLGHALVGAVRRGRRRLLVVLAVLAVAAAWTLTPLPEHVDHDSIERGLEVVRESPAGVPGVIVAFAVLAGVGAPVTLLITVVGSVYGFGPALAICLAGVLPSALAGFAAGRLISGRGGTGSGTAARIGRMVRDRGVLAVAIVRNLPVAPFAVVNVACGLTTLEWSRFAAGTLLGMLPGMVLLCLFGREIGAILADPSPGGLARLAGIGALVVMLAIAADAGLRKWRPGGGRDGEDEDDDGKADAPTRDASGGPEGDS